MFRKFKRQIAVFNRRQEVLLDWFIRLGLVKLKGDWYGIDSPLTDGALCLYADIETIKPVRMLLEYLLDRRFDADAKRHFDECERLGKVHWERGS